MKAGDRVRMPAEWREDPATGTIQRVTPDYVIVRWDDSEAAWYYPKEKAQKIDIIGVDISDHQLEHVHGGMGQGTYEIWKTRWINQDW